MNIVTKIALSAFGVCLLTYYMVNSYGSDLLAAVAALLLIAAVLSLRITWKVIAVTTQVVFMTVGAVAYFFGSCCDVVVEDLMRFRHYLGGADDTQVPEWSDFDESEDDVLDEEPAFIESAFDR